MPPRPISRSIRYRPITRGSEIGADPPVRLVDVARRAAVRGAARVVRDPLQRGGVRLLSVGDREHADARSFGLEPQLWRPEQFPITGLRTGAVGEDDDGVDAAFVVQRR